MPLVVPVWRKGTSSKLSKTGEQIEIFGLFKDVMSVEEAVSSLRSSVLKLKKHIYVAYCQWQKSRTSSSKLIPMTSLHSIEDYQMNISVTLDESPTSTHFGSNALSLACYPGD